MSIFKWVFDNKAVVIMFTKAELSRKEFTFFAETQKVAICGKQALKGFKQSDLLLVVTARSNAQMRKVTVATIARPQADHASVVLPQFADLKRG
jgi:hypothetical protein